MADEKGIAIPIIESEEAAASSFSEVIQLPHYQAVPCSALLTACIVQRSRMQSRKWSGRPPGNVVV